MYYGWVRVYLWHKMMVTGSCPSIVYCSPSLIIGHISHDIMTLSEDGASIAGPGVQLEVVRAVWLVQNFTVKCVFCCMGNSIFGESMLLRENLALC